MIALYNTPRYPHTYHRKLYHCLFQRNKHKKHFHFLPLYWILFLFIFHGACFLSTRAREGIYMVYKLKPTQEQTLTCNTCTNLWHSIYLSSYPPQVLMRLFGVTVLHHSSMMILHHLGYLQEDCDHNNNKKQRTQIIFRLWGLAMQILTALHLKV